MAKLDLTTKRMQIDKANVVVVVAVAAGVFITIFCLVSVKALWSQRSYQARVIEMRENARDQLQSNITAADTLTERYKQFVSDQPNVIGGSIVGQGERDGDNARIVLDALPSKYDFPALATSLEKLVKSQSLNIESIDGTDDEVNQAATAISPTPQPVEMPFQVTVKGGYDSVRNLINVFERSIRPFQISELTFTAGEANDLSLKLSAKTYYQPEKNLEFKSEVVQ